jgi:G3E family GTPase
MEKLPVNIISGFLGSGKTTAIIRLLKQKPIYECWAVIVNEFGKVSIDGQTLRSESAEGSVFDISGGCICCSAKGYFKENLEKIILTSNYDRIIIEPSGLGGIEMVSDIIEPMPNLELMPVICIVDISGLENLRLQRLPIYQAQILKADRIVFSKCDLLEEIEVQDQLVKKFKLAFPEKHFCITGNDLSRSILDTDSLLKDKNADSSRIFYTKQNISDINYLEKIFQFGTECIFDSEKLLKLFVENPCIVRAKGFILTENGWILLNYTLSGFIFEPCQAKELNELVIIAEKSEPINFEVENILVRN